MRAAGSRWRHICRTKLRPVWRDYGWFILAGLAGATLFLGYWGFRLLPPGQDGSPQDGSPFYRAIQLFALEGISPEAGDVPWQLDIARLAAPLIAGYAAVRGLLALFGEQLQLLWIRLATGNHVIVAGLGSKGFQLARTFHDAGFRVVAIESDLSNGLTRACRERGIPVIKGDASDDAVLSRARVSRARNLIVACGEDSTNLDVMVAAARIVPGHRPHRLVVLLHLDDLGLWRRLRSSVVGTGERFPFRIEFFNVFESAARILLQRYPPFETFGDARRGRIRVLAIGLDRFGENLVLQLARLWQNAESTEEDRVSFTIVGPAAGTQRERLLTHYPRLANIVELDAREVDFDSPTFERDAVAGKDGSGLAAVYVCLEDEGAGLAAALALNGRLETRDVPIIVTVTDSEGGVASLLQRSTETLRRVHAFAVLSETLSPDLLLNGTNEILAQAFHEHYLANRLARGEKPRERPALVPWVELSENYKESNRAAADAIRAKLDHVGYGLVPAPLVTLDGNSLAFSREETEKLAVMEHERWQDDLRRRDEAHPLREVAWEHLSDDERQKDRDVVRDVPTIVARAGFEISRFDSGEHRS
jgi:hypothetical protein